MSESIAEQITRNSGSNLALALFLLPGRARKPMSVLYAYCRLVDDIADEGQLPLPERRQQLQFWYEEIERIYSGQPPRSPLGRELEPVVREHALPREELEELLRGVEMDLTQNRYPDRSTLELYCYRVASVVGLLSIRIFGCTDPRSVDYAIHLGKALQLTNILRDVAVDARNDRIYLPQDECRRFGVTETEILNGQFSDRYARLAEHVAGWAVDHFNTAAKLRPAADQHCLVASELMGSFYWRLLERLRKLRFNVFQTPTPLKLSKLEKLWLILLVFIRTKLGGWGRYGTTYNRSP